MSQLSLSSFANRKTLKDIVKVPKSVQSVYSLTQHVWAGKNDAERQESKKKNRVRLETLDEFFLDPVRAYLNRIFEKVADGEGQGFCMPVKIKALLQSEWVIFGHFSSLGAGK